MSTQELLIQIEKLPLEDRLTLMEVLTRGLREELRPRKHDTFAASRLHGLLKTDGPAPTDEEIKEDYTRYLMEKYS